ncbi:MAG: hypothetical protein HOW97_18915 [Catenulispora sp.]|nr:hypothetical protein [Catenulispora sp.]
MLNGVIDAQGEEDGDAWQIAVADDVVTVRSNGARDGMLAAAFPHDLHQRPELPHPQSRKQLDPRRFSPDRRDS